MRWLLDDDRTARGSGFGFDERRRCIIRGEREGVVACAIIVLHSASSGRGCEKPASDCTNFRFYWALLCLLQSLDSTSAPPLSSLSLTGLWQVLKRIKWRVSTVLWIPTPTPRSQLLSSQSKRETDVSLAAISADLTLSGGNLIWGRSWHGLGEDVQVAIFRGRRQWLEREGITMGGYFPSRAPCSSDC